MNIVLRPIVVPGDYDYVAKLYNVLSSELVTVQDMVEEDALIPIVGSLSCDEDGRLIGHDRQRWIAEDGEGRILGYTHAWRAPWSSPGVLYEQVIVDPSERNKGIGRALYDVLLTYSSKVHANRIVFDIRDDDPESLRFATQRGYIQERHLFESCLELADRTGIKESERIPFGDSAFQMVTLADMPGEEFELRLYDLYRATNEDIPGFDGEYMWYSEWRKRTIDKDNFDRSLVILALDKDHPIGVVQLTAHSESQNLYNSFTGVDIAYRGQGIAMALKEQSITEAYRRGYRYIRTNNDSFNLPMLKINQRLGYKPVPGYYTMTRSND